MPEYVFIAQSFRGDRYRRRLRRKMGAGAVVALLDICAWAAEHRSDGHLRGLDAEDIVDQTDWHGDARELIRAFIECGFMDTDIEGELILMPTVYRPASDDGADR